MSVAKTKVLPTFSRQEKIFTTSAGCQSAAR